MPPSPHTLPDVEEELATEIKQYAHLVSPPENKVIFNYLVTQKNNTDPSAKDIVVAALEHGWPVVALCGYQWVPKSEGEGLDACQICFDVAGMHMRNAGE